MVFPKGGRMPRLAEAKVCGCGRSFDLLGAFSKHVLHCDGKPVQTRGRIDRLTGRPRTAPARKTKSKRAVPAARPAAARRSSVKRTERTAGGVTPAQMIAALRVERDKIDAAIVSIEALA